MCFDQPQFDRAQKIIGVRTRNGGPCADGLDDQQGHRTILYVVNDTGGRWFQHSLAVDQIHESVVLAEWKNDTNRKIGLAASCFKNVGKGVPIVKVADDRDLIASETIRNRECHSHFLTEFGVLAYQHRCHRLLFRGSLDESAIDRTISIPSRR